MASVRDASAVYKSGTRTLLLVHDPFMSSAKIQLSMNGTPDVPTLRVRQPMHLDPSEERQKAKDAVADVVRLLRES